MPRRAVIVFAHGARSTRWENPIRDLAKRLATQLSPCVVEVAFLQFGEPKLPEAVEKLIGQGVVNFVILPFFLSTGGHLLRDLPEAIDRLRADYPQATIDVASSLGEEPEVIDGFFEAGARLAQSFFNKRCV